MKFLILLLCICWADLIICAKLDEVTFPASILKEDLDAIEKYQKYVDNDLTDALIYWPYGIALVVKRVKVQNEDYLKVHENFKITKMSCVNYEIGELHYKAGRFYARHIFSKQLKPISQNTTVFYEPQGRFSTSLVGDSHLRIVYKSIEEVEEAIKPLFSEHKFYIQTYSKDRPSIYLATWDDPQQFLEYTMRNDKSAMEALNDGSLRVLLGKVERNRLKIHRNETFENLVFDPNAQPDNPRSVIPQYSKKNVFAVRMAKTGFLAEVRKKKVTMMNAGDIALGAEKPLSKHRILVKDFLEKTKRVEPMSCPNKNETCKKHRPKENRFQVHGHVLTKRANYLEDGEKINKYCPFVIEYEKGGADFLFGSTTTKQICTDNKTMWGGIDNRDWTYDPKEVVTLFYP